MKSAILRLAYNTDFQKFLTFVESDLDIVKESLVGTEKHDDFRFLQGKATAYKQLLRLINDIKNERD